ncbi:hypothetical protein GGR52DRAFT_571071 [Hypoxylon sp. FL1284]|nr:hypothetical protein GGR52DRAFT_571071 [Hypoxylon sp. FL1284]
MPHPQQQLARSAAVSARNGKGRAVYLEVEDDDDEDEGMISRLRARSKSRARTVSRHRAASRRRTAISSDEDDEDDDETIELSSPPRSTPVTPAFRSRHTSRHPSPSSSRSSSVDSDSSASIQDARAKRYAQKRRVEVPVTPPPPPVGRKKRIVTTTTMTTMNPNIPMPFVYERDLSPCPVSENDSSRQEVPLDNPRVIEVGMTKESLALRRSDRIGGGITSLTMSSSSRPPSALLNRFIGAGLQSPRDKSRKTVECVVCLDDLSPKETAKLKCGHRMCKQCLRRSFKLSVKDMSQMPPRCCTSDCIPLKHVEDLFDVNFKKQWNRKFHEFSTRNRIYCPGKRCGRWIRPDQIQRHRNGRKVGRCGACDTRVCCECNSRWHGSSPCPVDEETNQILQQAKEEGWQRCYNCRNMVELKEGCNHMTCRCGAEFCMICGLRWKTCECPWFNYDAAEADFDHIPILEPIIDRERLGLRTAPPAQRPRPTYEEGMYLRRLQEQRDEELARQVQLDDTEDDYMDPVDFGMDNFGMDNDPRHFTNRNHRRRARTVVAPPAPAPPPVAPFERTAASVVDYVSGVNRARGVRAGSMERRLADRFEQRQPGSPPHMGYGHSIPPPPSAPRAMGPPPVMQSPNLLRRHTVDEDLYDAPHSSRIPERMIPRRASTRGYIDDPGVYERGPRVRRRERAVSTSPKDSVLAGLTGPGRGMHRVYEWVNHVESDPTGLAA